MSKGWIKLHRQVQDHWLYPSGREFTDYEAWQDIILSVNHKPKDVRIKNRVLTCKRGQSLRSTKGWAKRWNWSKSKVYRFFNLLEQEGMIETESETVTTRLTVCNYCTYQDERNADETQMERKRNDPETQADTNKNEKNEKKSIATPPELKEVKEYFRSKGYTNGLAEKFYNYYQEPMEDRNGRVWKDSNGNTVKSWKQKAIAVWMDEDKKQQSKPKMQFV